MNSRDRELLAAEIEAGGRKKLAADVREGKFRPCEEFPFASALRAISQARIEEREAVVRWLRKEDWSPNVGSSAQVLALMIEKGDHLPVREGIDADR